MKLWDAMSAAFESGSARRGAMLAALRCDHPDIEAFIDAKCTPGELRHFNLSVLVTDAFMQAVERDAPWSLGWDAAPAARTVRARALWERIARRAWEAAEPGVLFIDRIRADSNLAYCEHIEATNPCGEVPLPAWGACDLGSLNLPRFVIEPQWVDNAISKTVTVPADCRFDEFGPLFDRAWQLGLKGVTAYRPNPITGAVLGKGKHCAASPACASAERGA